MPSEEFFHPLRQISPFKARFPLSQKRGVSSPKEKFFLKNEKILLRLGQISFTFFAF